MNDTVIIGTLAVCVLLAVVVYFIGSVAANVQGRNLITTKIVEVYVDNIVQYKGYTTSPDLKIGRYNLSPAALAGEYLICLPQILPDDLKSTAIPPIRVNKNSNCVMVVTAFTQS